MANILCLHEVAEEQEVLRMLCAAGQILVASMAIALQPQLYATQPEDLRSLMQVGRKKKIVQSRM